MIICTIEVVDFKEGKMPQYRTPSSPRYHYPPAEDNDEKDFNIRLTPEQRQLHNLSEVEHKKDIDPKETDSADSSETRH